MSHHSKSTRRMTSHVVLFDDLIIEVLSFLNVKSLMRFKSVSKSWNTLISDPTFVKLHLQHSPRNKHIAAYCSTDDAVRRIVTFPLNHLLENPLITIPINSLSKINDCSRRIIVGSCNGLLCLLGYSSTFEPENSWFHIWNPATNTISKRLGSRIDHDITRHRYTFGYDNATSTYKVVDLSSTEVKIFNFGDNSWRRISSFPPFDHVVTLGSSLLNDGVYLSGTVNWFAIRSNLHYNWKNTTVDQFVIISLDLGTETYMQLSPPRSVDEVPCLEPIISVLMDRLCFSYSFKGTHFVIWKMMEFGVEQSWTQFIKINFQNLGDCGWRLFRLVPLCLSESGHTLILASTRTTKLIFYNLRDNRVEKTCHQQTALWLFAKNYVESLASIC